MLGTADNAPQGPFDIAVIGAGVVGCALARQATLGGARTVVIEKADDILDGASKGNSAILHTGFDAPVGSLEQRLVARGYEIYRAIHDRLGLPLLKTGAMVLAWSVEDAERLGGLIEKAHQNGVADVVPLTRADILAREPGVSQDVVAGILVPGEHIIDPWTAPFAYLLQAIQNGATVMRSAEVTGGRFDGQAWTLTTTKGAVRAATVVNCAGLYGDRVDQILTGESAFEIRPRKGEFLVFDKAAANVLTTTLLPVPSETTKGIVVCRTVYGNVLVGPTAQEQESREDASVDTATLERLKATAARLVPALGQIPVTATYAGLRPATQHKDYQITHYDDRRYVSVGGIRSTGLSSALGVAEAVWSQLEAGFTPMDDPLLPRPPVLAEGMARDWAEPGHGGIVCHCELVTRREVEAALDGPLPARTLSGLKRRTRVTMGRCQGFYCLGGLAEITEGRLSVPIAEPVDG